MSGKEEREGEGATGGGTRGRDPRFCRSYKIPTHPYLFLKCENSSPPGRTGFPVGIPLGRQFRATIEGPMRGRGGAAAPQDAQAAGGGAALQEGGGRGGGRMQEEEEGGGRAQKLLPETA